ncbi:MAG: NAD-dependent epimerase/dehydratase family protein [Bauldia sp.]
MARRVAIFGYGAVGRDVANRLAARGDEVRVVQRTAPQGLLPGVAFVAGDASDPTVAIAACANVDTAVCAVGVKYDATVWEDLWPRIVANLLDGCQRSGARFVFADNLYLYGPQTAALTEEMPLTVHGRKPRVRAAVTRQWQEAHRSGRVRAVAVRASDFYGPLVGTSVLSTYGVARLLAGKAALAPYPADFPHDFTYVPDFARALVSLIDAPDDAYGQAWHVPNAPTRTLRELFQLAAAIIGVPPRVTVMPRLLEPIVALFVREVGELAEMRFQWDRPYRVDAHKFAGRFWNDPTPFEAGLSATVAAFRQAN